MAFLGLLAGLKHSSFATGFSIILSILAGIFIGVLSGYATGGSVLAGIALGFIGFLFALGANIGGIEYFNDIARDA